MKLHPLRHAKRGSKLNTWCGPTALSIITGRTIDHCAKLCADAANVNRYVSRKHTPRTIKGTTGWELGHVLHKMGYDARSVKVPWNRGKRETLLKYMRERGGRQWRSVMLVVAGHHWLVLHRDTIADSYRPEGCHYEEHPKRYCKLTSGKIVTRR